MLMINYCDYCTLRVIINYWMIDLMIPYSIYMSKKKSPIPQSPECMINYEPRKKHMYNKNQKIQKSKPTNAST